MYATQEEIRSAAGELITCGFIGNNLNSELKEIIRETQPAGIIFFARNFESPQHLAELAREIKLYRPKNPLLLSIDQEGGKVARVGSPASILPPMRTLGTIDDPQLTYEVGKLLAVELRSMNIDINFAPVLDVDTNPNNPIIADRSFGSHPELVARHGAALTQGLQDHGVGACGKHFPGHGDTHLDSHLELPFVPHNLTRLREIEWPPFRAAIEAGLSSVMSAHVVMEALEQKHPATLSPQVLGCLRNELAFEGVIVSDDLEMKAIAAHYSIQDMSSLGISAGIDHFLACKEPEVIIELYRSIIRNVENETISHETLIKKASKVRSWKKTFYQPPVSSDEMQKVGCEQHQRLCHEIEKRKLRITS